MEDWIDYISGFTFPGIYLVIGLVTGLLAAWVFNLVISQLIRRSHSKHLYHIKKRCGKPIHFLLPVLFIFIALLTRETNEWTGILIIVFRTLLILSFGFLLIRIVYVAEDVLLERYDITKKADNQRERKIITQFNFIKSTAAVVIVILTLGIVLLSFEGGQKFGAGLLTSAGVASIIIGFAAQKSIANFLAGIQIAFTQPIKIDDAVVVEGEWGWIEEINLTYVVVRIWDWRRLILPITYFVNEPFQNWTRSKAEIIGTVFLHLDYNAPIVKIREKLTEILKDEPNWDGKVNNLQVVDSLEKTIQLRALMSARNSPQAWDLRCSVREKLITFIQQEHPNCLPVHRVQNQPDQ